MDDFAIIYLNRGYQPLLQTSCPHTLRIVHFPNYVLGFVAYMPQSAQDERGFENRDREVEEASTKQGVT
jgi:hypothetical protein